MRESVMRLCEEIATARDVDLLEVVAHGKPRTSAIARARHEAWFRMRNDAAREWSYPDIAREFGVDHGSVMSGVRQHARRVIKRGGVIRAPWPSDAAASVPLTEEGWCEERSQSVECHHESTT